ncbi:PepSY-like domain-containing protein [Adhaeribacter radiodurans]|uniref:PepSY-like domain-containing protein n=1 Tax=Adhaeribacter radiodurans TaxID=2745197 RepID=A0A7L7L8E8_9BACT|nr:PepSY-like domain-containing protein [Adhaeribacter radiodurans]QMU29087.1 PepSY-like domain-containing protein [Adhaeribacter radiodurans]
MKAILFSILFSNTVFLACSQDIAPEKVPAIVKNAQQVKFPDATEVEWEKKPKGYEVEFNIGLTDYTALITSAGKITYYEQEIQANELPAPITAIIQKQFAGYTVDGNDLDKITNNGEFFYRVDLEKNHRDITRVFSATGKVVPDPTL